MWGRRKLHRLIEEAENLPKDTELEEARKARTQEEARKSQIVSRDPEVHRLNRSFLAIREKNNFATYWQDALTGNHSD